MKGLEYFLSFAFGFYFVTGLSLGYLASYFLLKTVAYLSPWLPVWMWIADIGLYVHAVAIAAASAVGVIAVLANKAHALKLCAYILVGLFLIEVVTTIQLTTRKMSLGKALHYDMEQAMEQSQKFYSVNISDTQMWDEIQLEVNCCGIKNYKDWFNSTFGNGTNVPDSCCLLVTKGCGQNISSKSEPEDEIITEGCLTVIMETLNDEFYYYGYHIWLPTLGGQVLLIIVIGYIVRKICKSKPRYYPYILSDAMLQYQTPKYQFLHEDN